MNNIVDIETIIENEIDHNNYIETLLSALLKYNIITIKEYDQIIFKFLNLLSIKIKKYTGELTSSVPIVVAKNINSSNMWIVSLYLKKFSIKKNIELLIDNDINDLYNLGKKELDSCISKTKFFYKITILNNLITTDNYFYNSTLKDGIEGFFKIYNPDYDSENVPITVDYEAYLERPKLKGIEFIKKYLEYINCENIFCKQFNFQKINKLLKKIYPNYEDIPINIFEHILTTTIILEYLKMDVFELNIFNLDISYLYTEYNTNSKEYSNRLNIAYNTLKEKLKLDIKTINYMDKCSKSIIKKIIYFTKTDNLEVLLGQKEITQIEYVMKSKMNDNKYREILNLLNQSNIDEKVDIIKNNVDSLYDIIDIFENVDFKSEEIFKIFDGFQIVELMVLKKWYSDKTNSIIFSELNRFIYTKSIEEQKIINDNYNFIVII